MTTPIALLPIAASPGPGGTDPHGVNPGNATAAAGSATVGVFLGRVTNITQDEAGKKFAEIAFEQGHFRVPVEADVGKGDWLRLVFVQGGVRVEPQSADAGTEVNPGFSLPDNLPSLRDLAVLEKALAVFLESNTEASANPLSESLPVLIQRVLEQPQGFDFLVQQLGALKPEALKVLTQALTQNFNRVDMPADPKAQENLVNLLQGFRRALSQLDSASPSPTDTQGYLRPAATSNLFLGRGMILDRSEIPVPTGAALPANAPMLRYHIDMGGAVLEAQSAEVRDPGEFAVFHLERDPEQENGALLLRFRDPQTTLPAELQSEYQAADAPGKAALLLASDFLKPDAQQPGSLAATRDFAKLLLDTGRLQGPHPSLPAPEELDTLFRLMLAYPRDVKEPTTQAHVWNEVARNPDAFAPFLRLLRPVDPAATAQASPSLNLQSPTTDPALRAALDQALQRLGTDPRLEVLTDLTVPPAASESKTSAPERFLLQALTGLGARDKNWDEGQSRVFYYYHQDEWRAADGQWSKMPEPKTKTKNNANRPPVQVRIGTETPNLGAVEINLALDTRGSRLDFRNELHDARQLLSDSLPPLKQLLQELDMRLVDWTYAPLATQSQNQKPTATTAPKPNAGSGPKGLVDLLG